MNIIQNILNSFAPTKQKKILFHYTTSEGLLGIINSKSIHLTEHQFLNDMDELRYGSLVAEINILELINEEYKNSLEKNQFDRSEIKFFEALQKELTQLVSTLVIGQYFIGCFTENGDDLSQWKGYSSFGEGYSVGFNAKKLIPVSNENLYFFKVIYDKKKQSFLVKKILKVLLLYNKPELDKVTIVKNGARLIFLLSCFFKNSKFAQEKEWRLLYFNSFTETNNIKCKAGRFGIHSYYSHPFELSCIKEIFVGPKFDFKLNFNSLNILLNNSVKIKKASINIK